MKNLIWISACAVLLAGCAAPPPVNDSRDVLWARYAHHPLDELLLAWGAPQAETKLTNGSRMVTYRHSTVYDAASPYEGASGCDVTMLAPPPRFTIENIAMTGDGFECSALIENGPGLVRNVYIPPPPRPFFTVPALPIITGNY